MTRSWGGIFFSMFVSAWPRQNSVELGNYGKDQAFPLVSFSATRQFVARHNLSDNDLKPDSSARDYLEVKISDKQLFVISVANYLSKNANLRHLGFSQFRRSIKKEGESKILIYILIPRKMKEVKLKYFTDDDVVELDYPRFIYRNKGSRLYTFAIVDLTNLGKLEAYFDGGWQPVIDFNTVSKELSEMPLHRDKKNLDRISFQDIPWLPEDQREEVK